MDACGWAGEILGGLERNTMEKASPPLVRPLNHGVHRGVMAALTPLFKLYVRLKIEGREHLPPEGQPAIMVVNHTSNLDAFACGYALGRPAYFLTKEEALETPVAGKILASIGGIPAKRDRDDSAALRKMRAILKAGHLLGLAPEGTRSADGEVQRYDPGFVWLASKTKALIIPTAIHGAHDLLPSGATIPRPGRMVMQIAEPIDLSSEGRIPKPRLTEIADEVQAQTRAMIEDLSRRYG